MRLYEFVGTDELDNRAANRNLSRAERFELACGMADGTWSPAASITPEDAVRLVQRCTGSATIKP